MKADFETIFRLRRPEERLSSGDLQKLTGGFSGARVYKYESLGGFRVLRIWPRNGVSKVKLAALAHFQSFLAQQTELQIPIPLPGLDGKTHHLWNGCFCHVESFVEGKPFDRLGNVVHQVQSALKTLAKMHRIAAKYNPLPELTSEIEPARFGISPSLQRRQQLLQEHRSHGWQLNSPAIVTPQFREISKRANQQLKIWGPVCLQMLEKRSEEVMPLQPVFRDLWSDHFRFDEAGNVIGMIDLNNVGTDSIWCDLSRLLGSLCGNDSTLWEAGIAAYAEEAPDFTLVRPRLELFSLSNLLLSTTQSVEAMSLIKESNLVAKIQYRVEKYLDRLESFDRLKSYF